MFKISDLLKYDDIVIQCHDVPDPDAIASGFAVYAYLKQNSKQCRFVYSGNREITKANLKMMIDMLNISIEYVKEPIITSTLVLVDVQSGNGNLTQCKADTVITIDHHSISDKNYRGNISILGSCSTLVWQLLRDENFDFDNNPDLSTALYYGLYTDTSRLEEISHPLDKDMRDSLKIKDSVFRLLRNNNLILSELESVGDAYKNNTIDTTHKFAIFGAKPCDPNILGIIADSALEVENVDLCIVYNDLGSIYKLSVRSCVREIDANEFTGFLTDGVGGGGGGHKNKSGAAIDKPKVEALPDYTNIKTFILARTREYYTGCDVIDSRIHNLDTNTMAVYKKRKRPVLYAKSTDIFPDGTDIIIRTLEGDVAMSTSENMYLMIGVNGEVYPIKADVWQTSYELTDIRPQYELEYSPTATKTAIKDKITSVSKSITEYAKPCVPTGERRIYAKKLDRRMKVFTMWDNDSYLTGVPGDYLAVSSENKQDVYIINSDIFDSTYEQLT